MKVSIHRLKQLVRYDAEAGHFLWRVDRKGSAKAGDIAGSECGGGYRAVCLDGHTYKAHRLAWFYVHGAWPVGHIDHIDGDTGNNRIANLRDVDRSTNLQNQRRAHHRSSTGVLGVFPAKTPGRFTAQIRKAGKLHYLGTFDDTQQAHDAYGAAKRAMHQGNTI